MKHFPKILLCLIGALCTLAAFAETEEAKMSSSSPVAHEYVSRPTLDGRFLFSQLSPGTYRIEVAAQGFDRARSQATSVGVGQTVSVNFTLSPAGVSQSVEVTAQ